MQKNQKSIEKKSSPQELERIRIEFFFSVPFKAFWKMVFIACDESIAIPMKEGVDSLNVASATAVVLYEVSRQRGSVTKGGPGERQG